MPTLSTRDLLEVWRESARDLFDVELFSELPTHLVAQSLCLHFGDMALLEGRHNATFRNERNKSNLSRINAEFLQLRILRRGRSKIAFGDQEYELGAGEIHLIDFSRPHRAITCDLDAKAALMAHSVVGYDPSRHPPVMRLDLNTPIGRMVGDVFDNAFQIAPNVSQDDVQTLTNSITSFLAAFIQSSLPDDKRQSFQVGRARSMHRFLDRNLERHDLGPEMLLSNFGAARATIYRDFEKDGGVCRYITDRRLEKAYAELAQNTPFRGLVQQVAEKWHFSSTSHFHRLFRRKFGCAPSEIVGRNHARLLQTP